MLNKSVKILNGVMLFIIAFILFRSYVDVFTVSKLTICALLVIVLFITHAVQFIRNNSLLMDKKYNMMFLLVNTIVLILFLRDKFDVMMPLSSANGVTVFAFNSAGLFIDYNAFFITILYAGVLLYNVLNCREKKNN